MSKQKIEEAITNAYVYVEGEQKLEERANALDFIAHLRANEMEIPLLDPAGDMIDVGYKGEGIITMELEAPGTGDTLECAKKVVDARLCEIDNKA